MSSKKTKKEHKKSFSQTDNPDSIWQRSSSQRQYGAKEIQDMLGIEDEERHDIKDKQPMKMMDIVMQSWGLDVERDTETEDDPNEDDEEEHEG